MTRITLAVLLGFFMLASASVQAGHRGGHNKQHDGHHNKHQRHQQRHYGHHSYAQSDRRHRCGYDRHNKHDRHSRHNRHDRHGSHNRHDRHERASWAARLSYGAPGARYGYSRDGLDIVYQPRSHGGRRH